MKKLPFLVLTGALIGFLAASISRAQQRTLNAMDNDSKPHTIEVVGTPSDGIRGNKTKTKTKTKRTKKSHLKAKAKSNDPEKITPEEAAADAI